MSISVVQLGRGVVMQFDITGSDDETTERVQRSLEAFSKDFTQAYLSDGSTIPVYWTDEDGDDVDELQDAIYVGGGTPELGYFVVALGPLRGIVFH